jgi:hypothetical protein
MNVSRINQNLLLKIIQKSYKTYEHYNLLIKSKFNYLQKIISSKWNDLQKLIKGAASLSVVHW